MANVMQVLGGASLLHQLARDVTTTLDRRLAPLGVTTQQAALLHNAASGGASPSQLMEAVGTDTAGMTKLLDRLQSFQDTDRRFAVFGGGVFFSCHALSGFRCCC